ncbi:MAG: substrate-binding domain-containing protein, partial [Treponema sp.]|nr:substrate-binding domain-containing protein [Treponema sp.]
MKKYIGILVMVLVLLSLVTPLFARGGGQQQQQTFPAIRARPGPYRAAFVTQAMSNESQAFSWKEFQRLAPQYEFSMRMFAGENEPAVEVAGIEQAIAERYDAIFINPSSIESIIPAITRAKQAGIIVGMFSSLLPPEYQHLMDFFCGSDDFLGGEQAGKFVSENFPGGANFVEVGGQAGHDRS